MKTFKTNFNRSNILESSHTIKILIKKLNGEVLLSSGNDEDYIYPRSSVKIFQAIPFVKSNGIDFFKLNSKKVALSCASHRGEKFHLKELESWVNKLKIKKERLMCGIHNPLNSDASENLFRSNKKVNQLHNNCAGKHLGMITSCVMKNYSLNNYLNFEHPYQVEIRKVFEEFSNNKIKKKNYGIDGCSAPQYAFKIKDVAQMLINLIKSYNLNFQFSNEVIKLIDSILQNPKYIGGTDSFDTRLMSLTGKKIFCKGGAEGVFLFIDFSKKIVGVIKVVDGNERPIPYVVHSLFRRYKILNQLELRKINYYYKSVLSNHANISIGSVKTNI